MTELLRVLIVDDEWTPTLNGVTSDVVHPKDADFSERMKLVETYDTLLIDQNLDLQMEISLSATDGASLVGHFRSWSRSGEKGLPPLVITTSDTEAFGLEIPAVGPAVPIAGSFIGREHRLAPSLDVEWLLQKSDLRLSEKVVSISKAWSSLLRCHGEPDALPALLGLITDTTGQPPGWRALARRAVTEATLPFQLGGVDDRVAARSTMRWLLHRTLAFPGVLVSDTHAAWALNVTQESLAAYAATGTAGILADCVYTGILSSLFPRRWWLAGLDLLSWEIDRVMGTDGADRIVRQQYLDQILPGIGLVDHQTSGTVIAWSADLVEVGAIHTDDAVQLRPPGWPIDAISPWASRSDAANDPLLGCMVPGSEDAEV